MTNSIFIYIYFPILAIIILTVNIVLSLRHTYPEKNSAFECGPHSFLGQNRTQFSISFFIFALLFLLFDLKIILVYHNSYVSDGVTLILIVSFIVTFSFSFRLGKQMNRAYENFKLEFSSVLKLINLYLVIYPFLCILGFIFLMPCMFSDKVAVFFTLLLLVYPVLNVDITLAIIFLALGKITSYTYAELKTKLKRVLINILIWAICALIFKQIIMFYFCLDPQT
jgi:NADH-ubiquinone oxidoreductase chain 3